MPGPSNQGEILDQNVKYPNMADITMAYLKEPSCIGLRWEISKSQNQLSSQM